VLSNQQIRAFADAGYILLSGLVSRDDLDRADAEVARLIAEAPPPAGHVGQHFYWPSPEASPAFVELLQRPGGILEAAGDLIAPGHVQLVFNQTQVALNIPPYSHRPGRPHIDGHLPGQAVPGTFTLLAGLLLNDQETENGGNLWVWPGTHRSHAAYFARHGARAFTAYPDVALPEPAQICGRRGDVLLAHYLLGHNIGGNYESERTRRALYWRLRAAGHAERWEQCLADEWCEFEGVRALLSGE
jgi:hypothetical protein